jgi:hypothetical protein
MRVGPPITTLAAKTNQKMNAQSPSMRSLDVELEERAELLSDAARMLPTVGPAERAALQARALAFLRGDIREHIEMDERLLYPKLAERLRDPLAAAPMTYEHRAIRWWADRIAHADLADVDELQRLLYGVYALIRVHLSREEDIHVGVLESPEWPAG